MLKLFTLTLKVSNKIAILLYKYTKKKKFEDTKRVIRSHKSKKNRQYNDQK